jgi:hypothetical protein
MGLNFNARNATVEHLNIRRAKGGDDDIIAIDIKLTDTLQAAELAPAMGATESDLIIALWDTQGEPHLLGIDEITTWGDFENHIAVFGRAPERTASVRKIKFKPGAEFTAAVTFTVTVERPGRELVSFLAESIREEIPVEIIAPPELPLEGGGA